MRGLFWRGIALALAGCVSWLLWHWPQPVEPEPVEFIFDECPADVALSAERFEQCERAAGRTLLQKRD